MATRLRYQLPQAIARDDAFDPFHRRLNDLTTDQRIHSAISKLQAFAAGFPSNFPRQDSDNSYGARADSSSSQDTTSDTHNHDDLHEHLTTQQLYFRSYWQALPVESPRSLSPTPPPTAPSWGSLLRAQEMDGRSHSPPHATRHKVFKGRITKPAVKHSMVTRSRVRPGQRFLELNPSGRPP